jgi:hypothetical protein
VDLRRPRHRPPEPLIHLATLCCKVVSSLGSETARRLGHPSPNGVIRSPAGHTRLIAAVGRLDDGEQPVAEIHRRLGTIADELGLAQPSYQRVRLLVRELRAGRDVPGTGDVLLDVALRNRPPETIIAYLSDHPQRAS